MEAVTEGLTVPEADLDPPPGAVESGLVRRTRRMLWLLLLIDPEAALELNGAVEL